MSKAREVAAAIQKFLDAGGEGGEVDWLVTEAMAELLRLDALVNEEGNAMYTNTYELEGGKAYREGKLLNSNPYALLGRPRLPQAADAWATGYRKASIYDTRSNG